MNIKNKWQKPKVLLVADPGGHFTELLVLAEAFDDSYEKMFATFPEIYAEIENSFYFKSSNLYLDLLIFPFKMFYLLISKRPKIIVSTGSHIGLIAIVLGKCLLRSKCIFMECSAQVYTPSRTGKIVYFFADLFLVQWEELLEKYGNKAKFVGGLI